MHYDDRNEPGYDPGPDAEAPEGDLGECDCCGDEATLDADCLCADCAEAAEGADVDAAYAAAPGWKRCSWGYCEDFGADL
jgi:hypothetical protein